MVKEKPVALSPEEFRRVRRAFANGEPGDRVAMFRSLADTMVPGLFEWHGWTLKLIESVTRYRWTGVTGCSGSCKTFNIANFAAVWWLCDPMNSSVIFCSTTMKMLRKRGWAEILKFNQSINGEFGNFVNSQTVWQADQGTDKYAIFGKAVCEGDTNKAAADIQGIHTKRQMLVIDEAPAVPAAIWKAIANIYAYPDEFICIAIGNARSRLDQFGRFIEPEDGWQSVSLETDEWMSKPQLDGKRANVIRFDFRKSPNITEGKMVSRHLPTKQRVEGRLAALKARGGENDPEHFCYDLGLPVPEGLSRTVFTETLFEKFRAYDKHQFIGSNFLIIGAIDPAYGGGDRPAIRFAAMGDIAGHKKGIEWCGDPVVLYLDATSALPVHYQLLEHIKHHCQEVQYRGQKYVCKPENFGIDDTGTSGLSSIAIMEWSPQVIRINFAESPSDEPCSHEDERPAKEVYANKRSEMFWRTYNAVVSEQIRGVDKDTAAELTTIEELIERTDGTVRPRKTLQNKKQYKQKYGKSCDLADVSVMITEVARRRGFTIAAVGLTTQRNVELDELNEKAMAIYDEDSYFRAANDVDEAEAWV